MLHRKRNGRVLVLGNDTFSFLSVIRSLGRHGLRVHVGSCPLNSPSLRSKYVSAVHRLPPYQADGVEWVAALSELLEKHDFDLVVPCHDSEILPLQHHRNDLSDAKNIYLLTSEVFEICFSKRRTYELAAQLGIRLSRQRIVRSLKELESAAAEFGLPIILKPDASASLVNPLAKHYVKTAYTAAELPSVFASLRDHAEIQVQEYFAGKGVGVETLCLEGNILVAFQHERVHEPIGGGGSSYRKSVPLHRDLLEATRRLMWALRYTGVAMTEFKFNPDTGDWILIEVNSRFWGSLPLSIAAGLDFPWYLYEMLCFGKTDFPTSYKYGVFCRNWVRDYYWLRSLVRSNQGNHGLGAKGARTSLRRTLVAEVVNALKFKEHSDTLVFDDPLPAFVEIAQLTKEKIEPSLWRLPGSRHRMRTSAEVSIRTARSILFLCKGNVCRSPFAELRLRALRRSYAECQSAGFYPVQGRQPPRPAIEVAMKMGVDLSAHRSRVVNEEMVRNAEAIFIFDRENRRELAARFPECLVKTHYLGALHQNGPLEIDDPYGTDTAEIERAYLDITRLLSSCSIC